MCLGPPILTIGLGQSLSDFIVRSMFAKRVHRRESFHTCSIPSLFHLCRSQSAVSQERASKGIDGSHERICRVAGRSPSWSYHGRYEILISKFETASFLHKLCHEDMMTDHLLLLPLPFRTDLHSRIPTRTNVTTHLLRGIQ